MSGSPRCSAVGLSLILLLVVASSALGQADEPAASDVAGLFPVTIAGEPTEVDVSSGPEWVERLVAGGLDEAAAEARVADFVEAVGKTPEELTVATALIEPSPGNVATITAIAVTGVRASRLVAPAIESMLAIESPSLSERSLGDKQVTRVRDEAVPGSYPLTLYDRYLSVLWIVDAQKPLLVDVVEALPLPAAGRQAPGISVNVTWPDGWRMESDPPSRMEEAEDFSPVDLLGPEDVAWAGFAYARPQTKGSNFECSLQLYESTGLTLTEIAAWFTRLESPGGGVEYEPAEVEWRNDLPAGEAVAITMRVDFFGTPTTGVFYWIDGGDAIAVLGCGGGEPADAISAAVETIAPTIEFLAIAPES